MHFIAVGAQYVLLPWNLNGFLHLVSGKQN